jgi:hypothetical protein
MVVEEVDQIQVALIMLVANEREVDLTIGRLVLSEAVLPLVQVQQQSVLQLVIIETSINLETLQQFVICQLEEITRLGIMIQVVDQKLALEHTIQYGKETQQQVIMPIYLRFQITMVDLA